MEKVLVTGATGHVGSNLVRELLKKGKKVSVLINRTKLGLEDLNVEIRSGNILDPKSLGPALEGIDVVYHCAGRISTSGDKDGLVFKTNVEGVKNMAEAALSAKVKRFIHISSCHAFRLNILGKVVDENTPKVTKESGTAYDFSKVCGEIELQKVITKGLDAVILNPTGIIGRNDFLLSRMGDFFLKLYFKKLPALIDGGFDFVDVRDVAKAAFNAEKKGRTGENYLISGRYFSVRELSNIVGDIIGVKIPRFDTPIWPLLPFATICEIYGQITKTEPALTRDSLNYLRANNNILYTKANKELDHFPRDIRETVRDVYKSFRQTGVIPPDSTL